MTDILLCVTTITLFYFSGTAVITPEELDPFVPHVLENLEDKNVDLVVSCLKFLSSATTNRSVCQYLLTRHKQELDEEQGRDKVKSFLFVVTKKCRQYHPMRNREPYNAICMVRGILFALLKN